MTTTTDSTLSVKGLFRYHDVVGLLSAGEAGFSNPVAMAFGPDGLMYVASRANRNQPEAVRITRCTRDGDYVGQFGAWGTGEGEFIWVTGIAFSGQGELFVADEHNQRVSVFTPEGALVRCFGRHGSGDGEWDRPSGIAFDADDNLLVVDTLNHRVQRYDHSGAFLGGWGELGDGEGKLDMPWGVAVDSRGDVYVTDWRNDRVQKFGPDGKFLMAFGRTGAGDGEFRRPNGITVDAGGDIYVCDWMNDRVQVFDAEGAHKDTLIGHGGESKWSRTYLSANPEVDEKLKLAAQNIPLKMRFYRPVGVKVDDDGKVYVVDCYRHRVQIYARV